jgi:hypothetical protein
MKANLYEQLKEERIEEIMYEIYNNKHWMELQTIYSYIGTGLKTIMPYANLELLSDCIKVKFGKLYDEMAE